MRLAITSNGPGELAGWVRPLARALERLQPATELSLFFVPDDYATGREPEIAHALFPAARIVAPREYVRFALGHSVPDAPQRADVVQYLGGDLMHAARVHARLGGVACTYKFSRPRYARTFARAFALDERNVAELERCGTPRERIALVGNLAVDGALAEVAGPISGASGDGELAPGGVLFMPGTRRHEIANLIPFFLAVALRLARLRPELPVGFGLSPFTSDAELERALEAGGHPKVWGARGRLAGANGGVAIEDCDGRVRLPIVHDALRHAVEATLVVTIPGTKCIELAALGVPAIVCVPLNAPEVAVINGPLQYIGRLPVAGTLLKRAAALQVESRFPLAAQPNIDAGEQLMPELRGTLTPGYVAERIAAYANDDGARAAASLRLRELYVAHAGAAERMARSLLEAGGG